MADAHASGSLVTHDLFGVKDYVCVVTGGGTGIGLMIAQGLAKNGATVYITGRRKEMLDKAVKVYGGKEGEIIGIQCDITDKQSLESCVQSIQKQHPQGINLLVNNAGVALEAKIKGKPPANMGDLKAVHDWMWSSQPDAWQDTFSTNITGQYFTAVAFLPLLHAGTINTLACSASIINITSVSGVLKDSRGEFAYSCSKAATIHLTRLLATAFKDLEVRVNSIAPGLFPSEQTGTPADEFGKSMLEQAPRSRPAERPGNEEDIAGTVIWLAGTAGLFMNGQIVYLDGGLTLVEPSAA